MNYPTNTDDVIDSRQVIEAIEELTDLPSRSVAEQRTLNSLTKLAETLRNVHEDYGTDSPEDGQQIVRGDHFETYAQELVIDCGYFDARTRGHDDIATINFTTWPYRCIDWERVASELQQDYTSVDFDGVTYWVR